MNYNLLMIFLAFIGLVLGLTIIVLSLVGIKKVKMLEKKRGMRKW